MATTGHLPSTSQQSESSLPIEDELVSQLATERADIGSALQSSAKGNDPADTNTTDENTPVPSAPQGVIKTLPPTEDIKINHVAQKLTRPHQNTIRDSIQAHGQLEPGKAFRHPDGTIELFIGLTRLFATRELDLDFLYTEVSELGHFASLDDWVEIEYGASQKNRNLTKAQKALDAANLCIEKYYPAAQKRISDGIAVSDDEKGRSHELAARATGVKPSAVRSALRVVGTPLECLVAREQLSMTAATRYAKLVDADQKALSKAVGKNDIEAIKRLLSPNSLRRDALGAEIPESLTDIFDEKKTYQRHVKAIRNAFTWLSKHPNTSLSGQTDVKTLSPIADTIEQYQPHCVCVVCEADGDDCRWCHQSGWLSKQRYAEYLAERKTDR